MRSSGWFGGLLLLAMTARPALASPKDPVPQVIPYTDLATYTGEPKATDFPFTAGDPHVFTDPNGGTFVVALAGDGMRMFYGTGKKLYEQPGTALVGDYRGQYVIEALTPRLANYQSGGLIHYPDGHVTLNCIQDPEVPLTELQGDQKKQRLAKLKLYQPALPYKPYLLTRDDRGTYYYLDQYTQSYGGSAQSSGTPVGIRLFIGKRGAMKRVAISDFTYDTGGTVVNTKVGDFRLASTTVSPTTTEGMVTQTPVYEWIRGEKHTTLVNLDVVSNRNLIYTDLGVYTFLGSICDNPTPDPRYGR